MNQSTLTLRSACSQASETPILMLQCRTRKVPTYQLLVKHNDCTPGAATVASLDHAIHVGLMGVGMWAKNFRYLTGSRLSRSSFGRCRPPGLRRTNGHHYPVEPCHPSGVRTTLVNNSRYELAFGGLFISKLALQVGSGIRCINCHALPQGILFRRQVLGPRHGS